MASVQWSPYNSNVSGTSLQSNQSSISNPQGTNLTSNPSNVDKPVASSNPLSETPKLPPTNLDTTDMARIKNLCAEALMVLFDAENRQASLNAAKTNLEVKAEQREKANEERVANLKEQCEKLKEQRSLDQVSKIFKGISAFLGLIASLATFAAAVASGNVLLMVGSAMMAFTALDQTLSACSDGKVCVAGLATEIAKSTGGDVAKAQEIANYCMLGITVLGAALNVTALIQSPAQIANLGKELATKLTHVTNGLALVSKVGDTSLDIVIAVHKKDTDILKAKAKDIEAVLLQLQVYSDCFRDVLQSLMEHKEAAAEVTKDILKSSNESLTSIVTSGQANGGAMMA